MVKYHINFFSLEKLICYLKKQVEMIHRCYMIKYHYVYEDGIAQEAWTDPDTGEKCTVYRLVVRENGEVSEQYHFFDESVYKENVRYVYDGPNMY